MDNTFDRLYYNYGDLIGGVDESGVSDLAGPLVASCVIIPKFEDLPDTPEIYEIDDSKNLSDKYRRKYAEVIWNVATAIGIGEVQPAEIDYLGQAGACRLAMLRAVMACKRLSNKKPVRPDFLMVDGHHPIGVDIKQTVIMDGDKKSMAVAASSIVAKVYRDNIMCALHERYPYYGWNSNKGYPCETHCKGIDEHGVQIGIHRMNIWPISPLRRDIEHKDEEWKKRWSRRRKNWRRVTERKFGAEIGEDLWTTKPPSFRRSTNSRRPPRKGANSGQSTSTSKQQPEKKRTNETSL